MTLLALDIGNTRLKWAHYVSTLPGATLLAHGAEFLENIDKLDSAAVKTALFTAFKKTIQKNGYDIDIQVINKTKVVRLVSSTLVKEGVTIIKE